jgi:hypothetical protein
LPANRARGLAADLAKGIHQPPNPLTTWVLTKQDARRRAARWKGETTAVDLTGGSSVAMQTASSVAYIVFTSVSCELS